MSAANGRKPPMDVNLLTPNDYRRLRAKIPEGLDLDQLLAGGYAEDVIQTITLGFKLREDPEFTWDQAGDIAPATMFDMTGGEREPDPPTGPDGSPGPEAEPNGAAVSKPKRPADVSAPS